MATQLELAIQPDSHAELESLMEFPTAFAPEMQRLSARVLPPATAFPRAAQVFPSELELPPTASVIHLASDSR